MDLRLLEEIGLTKGEIAVYMALLDVGSSTVGPIIDKANVSSSKVYDILERLMDKGLVSFVIKSGTKNFEAADPERLLDYMKEKKRSLNEQEDKLTKFLPELKLKQAMHETESETTVFKGIKGAETAFQDILNQKEEVVVMGFSDVPENFQDFLVRWHNKRANKKIKCRAVFGTELKKLLNLSKLPHTKVKAHPLDNPIAILTYGEKTLFSLANDNLWIQVKNKRLARANKARFEELWEQDTVVTKGFKAMKHALYDMINNVDPKKGYTALNACWGDAESKERYVDFFKEYHRDRKKKKVNAKLLFQPNVQEILNKNLENYNEFCQYKTMPYEPDSPVEIFTTENKVIIMIQESNPTIITVNNKTLAKTFKTSFESLWDQDAKIVKGLDGIQDIFEQILASGSCDFISAEGYFMDMRPKYIDEWEKRAIKHGFKMRNIVNPEAKGHRITKFPFAKTKYTIPKEFAKLSVIWIFANKVVIANYTEKEPIAFVIENESLQQMYKTQFELLWKKDKL